MIMEDFFLDYRCLIGGTITILWKKPDPDPWILSLVGLFEDTVSIHRVKS